MENYTLAPNETVLFKCDTENGITVVLTNVNLVIIKKIKKLFSKEQVTVDVYSNDDIKIYNNVPQIKQKDCEAEIFLTSTEITVAFNSKSEARKFISAAFELLTGKTSVERGATKIKNTIGLVDDTLGIDTVGTVKTVLENGVTKSVFGILGKKTSIIKNVASVPKISDTANGGDAYIEKLKKLQELLDAGVITQAEFDAKKQELLSKI